MRMPVTGATRERYAECMRADTDSGLKERSQAACGHCSSLGGLLLRAAPSLALWICGCKFRRLQPRVCHGSCRARFESKLELRGPACTCVHCVQPGETTLMGAVQFELFWECGGSYRTELGIPEEGRYPYSVVVDVNSGARVSCRGTFLPSRVSGILDARRRFPHWCASRW